MKLLAGYQLHRELGRGATAQVFLASPIGNPEARVALKVFHPGFFEQGELRRRAESEFKAVSGLEHPGIVRVLESRLWPENNEASGSRLDDPPAVAFEFIDGDSLEQFQSRLPYVLPEVGALIVLDVLRALSYAHSKGIIHRDLKPANILVSREGRVVVTDFGLSRVTDASRLTLSGAILGSPDFMSPEQARGERVTEASDVFSAAAVLYALVTGTRPFSRHTPLATLAAVIECKCEPAQKRNPKLSPGLARILERALSPEPGARYQSATELVHALSRYLEQVGLPPAEFTLARWIQSPPENTLRGLTLISNQLAENCAAALRAGRKSEAHELLAHLASVSPESSSLGHLMAEARKGRRTGMRARVLISTLLAGACAGILLLSLGGARWLGRGQPGSVASSQGMSAAPAPSNSAAAPLVNPTPAQDPQGTHELIAVTEPRAPAPKPRGLVRFELPDGVKVTWDDRDVSPRSELKAERLGTHRLRLVGAGVNPIERVVRVEAGNPTIIRAFLPEAQQPEVSKFPVQFEVSREIAVYWDGQKVDAERGLPHQTQGLHHLRLERAGFKPVTSEVLVGSDEPTVIRAQ